MPRENRTLVMLAQDYDAAKHRQGGMWLSEKLDGMRAIWIPETVGMKLTDMPFANVDKKVKEFISTGLWSRYGNPIFAPKWFLEGFPDYCVDGELWIKRQSWDSLMSAVKKHEPVDSEWEQVKMYVFEKPHYDVLFRSGRINETQYKKQIDELSIRTALNIIGSPKQVNDYTKTFDIVYRLLKRDFKETASIKVLEQEQLPFNTEAAKARIAERLEEVTEGGGEGLMLRHPGSEYETIRSKFLLKIKKLLDAEATVVGYRAGQGKYLGMLGSLRVQWEHGTFELGNGMADHERVLATDASNAARISAGELLSVAHASDVFPLGTRVTFRYRELTPDQMPKEGRYLRKYQPC